MTKEKMNKLYKKSQEIVIMMNELGISNYKNYALKFSSQGTFLTLGEHYITSSLKSIYIENDLSKFMPATSIDILSSFERDINNNFFKTLENIYNEYIK